MDEDQMVSAEVIAAGEAPRLGVVYLGGNLATVRSNSADVRGLQRQAAGMEPGTKVAVSPMKIEPGEGSHRPMAVTWKYMFLAHGDKAPHGWQTHLPTD